MKKATAARMTPAVNKLRTLPVPSHKESETRPTKNVSGTLKAPNLTNDTPHMKGTWANSTGTARKK